MKIKLIVSTGWANGDHVDYQELPENWEQLTAEEQEIFLGEAIEDYLHLCCESAAFLVEDDD